MTVNADAVEFGPCPTASAMDWQTLSTSPKRKVKRTKYQYSERDDLPLKSTKRLKPLSTAPLKFMTAPTPAYSSASQPMASYRDSIAVLVPRDTREKPIAFRASLAETVNAAEGQRYFWSPRDRGGPLLVIQSPRR